MNIHRKEADKPLEVSTREEMEGLLKARMSLGHLMNDTHAFTSHDYELIGKFVQTYCIADLEARRMINCLVHIKTGEPAAFALKLNDKDALTHLMACADDCVWNPELAAGIRKAAEILVLHRRLRHIFAHWAGRRIPGHEAFIFYTSSLGTQKIPKGAVKFEEHENPNMQYAIMPISNLIQEQTKLQGHVQYLATTGAQLEATLPKIAKTTVSGSG